MSGHHPALHTRFCDLVGVQYPIVQTGMGWVAGPRLVSATANAGGLGILAGATMTWDQFGAAIRDVKGRTDKPFGVNLRGDQPDAFDRADVMIEEARDLSTLQAAPHALIFPGIAIALTVLAFNFIGDGLREYLDPRQRAR